MKLVLLILFSILYAPVSAVRIYAQDPSSLDLSVSFPKRGSGRYAIGMQLKNSSDRTVTIQNLDLPWIPPNEMIFVSKVYRLDKAHTPLSKFGPMADYMNVPYTLAPGQVIQGSIDLTVMFPTFTEEVRRFGVTVEWACRSKALTFQCQEGSGGQFTIAAKRKQKSTIPQSPPPSSIK